MPNIILRPKAGESQPLDLTLHIKDNTYDYLMTTQAEEVRVSAFFENDFPMVQDKYEELFVNEECNSRYFVKKIIPGSKSRKVTLPSQMLTGEQLTIIVHRK